ncbi:MAG TPA: PIN domain-containing protein [Candidatus Paceibacterota bacterium]|nr:PIN domain-containing protein [Candidatus Paceibacterota bacterium]
MKVLVDSTVWIDFLNARQTEQTQKFKQCIRNYDTICLCGFVLVEVLQGIRDGKQLIAAKQQFENLTYLEEDRSTFELGAKIYRELRQQGITIRNAMDCLISAVVIQHGVNFLENDRDYKFIDRHYPLNRL